MIPLVFSVMIYSSHLSFETGKMGLSENVEMRNVEVFITLLPVISWMDRTTSVRYLRKGFAPVDILHFENPRSIPEASACREL